MATYLATPEGKQKAYEKMDKYFLVKIFNDPDPLQTLIRNFQEPDEDDLTDRAINPLADENINNKMQRSYRREVR